MIPPAVPGYELELQLQRTAQSQTWRGRDGRGEEVVLKGYPSTSVETVVTFTSLALSASRLKHWNVAPIRGRGKSGELLFIVRDYFRGAPLETMASSLSTAQRLNVALHIGRALEQAHLHGLVHGAVKPSNVFFEGQGRPVLVDFVLAPSAFNERFAPPEQTLAVPKDPRLDQFGLAALTRWLLSEPTADAARAAPGDAALQQAIERAMSATPERRFRQLGEFVSEIEAAGERASQPATLDPSHVEVKFAAHALQVTITGTWTMHAVEACTRGIAQAMKEHDAQAIGYVLNAHGGCHSKAIDTLTDLHRKYRSKLKRVGFVSDSPQARGASVLIGTRVSGLDWKTFSTVEVMDAWLREVTK